MIKFFRKIRQQLLSDNKFTKYLIYAIGEIVLVVIGILIALQINNWNERLKVRQVEHKLLIELHKSITDDIKNLNDVINRNRSYISSAEVVLNAIDNKQIINDSVSHHLQRAFKVWKVNIKASAYHNLKEYGLQLIKNEETRKAILSAYDGRAKFVDLVYARYDQFLFNVVEPKLADQLKHKAIGDNDYGLFPLNNDPTADHHSLHYLLIKSKELQGQIVRAEARTINLFEKLAEDLKIEMEVYED